MFAMENELISADAIEATEFPELVNKYRVYAVPKTIVNGNAQIEGTLPEDAFLDRVLNCLGVSKPRDSQAEL